MVTATGERRIVLGMTDTVITDITIQCLVITIVPRFVTTTLAVLHGFEININSTSLMKPIDPTPDTDPTWTIVNHGGLRSVRTSNNLLKSIPLSGLGEENPIPGNV